MRQAGVLLTWELQILQTSLYGSEYLCGYCEWLVCLVIFLDENMRNAEVILQVV
jgi:hypothetical protein